MSELKIKSKPRCTVPSLISVTQLNNNSVTVSWVLNGIDYTSGSILIEYSVNGGASFIGIQTVNPSNLSVTINNSVFNSIANGQSVIFRLTGNSLNCSNMISNTLSIVWIKDLATNFDFNIQYSCTARGEGPTNYDVTCEGSDAFTLLTVTGLNAQYRLKVTGDDYYIGMTTQNGSTIPVGTTILASEQLIIQVYQSEAGYPGNYPWGQHILLPPTPYTFEYTINNGITWNEFTITIKE